MWKSLRSILRWLISPETQSTVTFKKGENSCKKKKKKKVLVIQIFDSYNKETCFKIIYIYIKPIILAYNVLTLNKMESVKEIAFYLLKIICGKNITI